MVKLSMTGKNNWVLTNMAFGKKKDFEHHKLHFQKHGYEVFIDLYMKYVHNV